MRTRTHAACGCPYCAGRKVLKGFNDLFTCMPEIAAQWHPTLNGTLTPYDVTHGSKKKVWWICEQGHVKGFNDLFTCMPEIAAQWHPTLNGTLTPYDVTHGSKKKVWWICEQGHVWCASIASRTGGKRCGCPVCAGKVKAQKQAYHAKMIAEHKKNDR